MKDLFEGWNSVAERLLAYVEGSQRRSVGNFLNEGQLLSLVAIAKRIPKNGLVIADEVGMGKTRIAAVLVRCVVESGGRAAILIPPGLGYQWREELRAAEVDLPPVIRSMWSFLEAWKSGDAAPWFENSAILVSHSFTNWKLGEGKKPWRWSLLPELYSYWRKMDKERFPRDYHNHEMLQDGRTKLAAESICKSISIEGDHPAFVRMTNISNNTPWPGALSSAEYCRNGELRGKLLQSVGLGLGTFELVVIDEAHKNRDTSSCLSELLNEVMLLSKDARRLGMTATPVELHVGQWGEILDRISVEKESILPYIRSYDEAVKRLRLSWRTSVESRANFHICAKDYENALSPFVLRRDKREDPSVRVFGERSGSCDLYRRETEITITMESLSQSWREAVCAAESLSVVASQASDPIAQRLRLTLGNGHGVAALLDQVKRENDDRKQEESDQAQDNSTGTLRKSSCDENPKRSARASWWLDTIVRTFAGAEHGLFEHPAILAAVSAIEKCTNEGEKVLVFGRFTRPMRGLVGLLNAREMLRRLKNNQPWPQSKVHGEKTGSDETSEWPAVRAALKQLELSFTDDEIELILKERYDSHRRKRDRMRLDLLDRIKDGLSDLNAPQDARVLFDALRSFTTIRPEKAESDVHLIALIARAIEELLGDADGDFSSEDYAQAFCDLLGAVRDRDEGDADGDGELDEAEAADLWQVIQRRMQEEYNRPQGGFARFMFGGTSQESRRMIQLAFNRPQSFPRVLVAQSMVGREGLNLHKACRVVVLLHPEWNPGVVEQQIGRVDRVGSHWSKMLEKSIKEDSRSDDLPHIEVRPLIFKGTYDEHNWRILRERWDDLRAQLHGIVIPPNEVEDEFRDLAEAVSQSAPKFSPK